MSKKNNFSRIALKGEPKWKKEWDKYFVSCRQQLEQDDPLWVKIQRQARKKMMDWENNKNSSLHHQKWLTEWTRKTNNEILRCECCEKTELFGMLIHRVPNWGVEFILKPPKKNDNLTNK